MKKHGLRLLALDALLLVLVGICMLVIYPNHIYEMNAFGVAAQIGLSCVVIFGVRTLMGLYRYVWRYVGTAEYLRIILSDALAGVVYYVLQWLLPMQKVTFIRAVVMICINLLATIVFRLAYQYLYEARSQQSRLASLLRAATATVTGIKVEPQRSDNKIHVAIIGAGRVGVGLAEELISNPNASYRPCCFVDTDPEKYGRNVNGLPVLRVEDATREQLANYAVQEAVIALPDADAEHKQELYRHYSEMGLKVKTYDFPMAQRADGKRSLREFDVEELLFRQPVDFVDDATRSYYTGKTILISGGGGSIGAELSRQIARMQPKKLVILDVYENCAYDLQQELKLSCPELELAVEIVTITDREELDAVLAKHRPDIVLHAAAHKHVPLMETNCCEAVKNNVFGTSNMVEAA